MRPADLIASVLCALVLLGPSALAAQPAGNHDARTGRLPGLSASDLKRLKGPLSNGPVALIEFADTSADQLPAVNVALRVHAPARAVADLVARPQAYPRFMKTLDEVTMVGRHDNIQVYDWRWAVGLFELSGRNSMTTYPPPVGRPEAGYRITMDSQSGDFGRGRISVRVLPRGDHESLMVVAMRLDLRRSNYLLRQMAKAARSVNRSANMSLAFTMALSLRREAERRQGYEPPDFGGFTLGKPKMSAKRLAPLLGRGDVVFLDMHGDRLNQISVFGYIHRPHALVHQVMHDAKAFGSALVPGSKASIVKTQGDVTTFDWGIDLPLMGVSGRMTMSDEDDTLCISATGGALKGGHWRFDAERFSKHATMVTGWASFDLKKSNWLLKELIESDPYLGHGITAASEVMLVRALRSKTRKLAEKN